MVIKKVIKRRGNKDLGGHGAKDATTNNGVDNDQSSPSIPTDSVEQSTPSEAPATVSDSSSPGDSSSNACRASDSGDWERDALDRDYYEGGWSQWRNEEWAEPQWKNWDWPPAGWKPESYHGAYYDQGSEYHGYRGFDWDQYYDGKKAHASLSKSPTVRYSPQSCPSRASTEEVLEVQEQLQRANTGDMADAMFGGTPMKVDSVKEKPTGQEGTRDDKTTPAEAHVPNQSQPENTEQAAETNVPNQSQPEEKQTAAGAEAQVPDQSRPGQDNTPTPANTQAPDPSTQGGTPPNPAETQVTAPGNSDAADQSRQDTAPEGEVETELERRKKDAHARYMRYFRNIRSPSLRFLSKFASKLHHLQFLRFFGF